MTINELMNVFSNEDNMCNEEFYSFHIYKSVEDYEKDHTVHDNQIEAYSRAENYTFNYYQYHHYKYDKTINDDTVEIVYYAFIADKANDIDTSITIDIIAFYK